MKKFEFSYRSRGNDDMHFVTVFDDSLISACERVLCRPVRPDEVTGSVEKNKFIRGWEDTHFTIHEQPYEPSSHVAMSPQVKSSSSKIDAILDALS